MEEKDYDETTRIIKEATSNEFKKFQAMISLYSIDELLSTGRDSVKELDFPKAWEIYNELAKRDSKSKEISQIYHSLINAGCHFSSKDTIDKIVNGMIESTRLHSEGNLEKEDLFTIEKLIDNFPLKTMNITLRDEFEKLYGRFKEYCLEVFLK